MNKLKDAIQFYWDIYEKDRIYLETPFSGLEDYHRGRLDIVTMILEEKIIDYYNGNSIDSENRAHAEMVLEILGVY